jgi:hypothetical protein
MWPGFSRAEVFEVFVHRPGLTRLVKKTSKIFWGQEERYFERADFHFHFHFQMKVSFPRPENEVTSPTF